MEKENLKRGDKWRRADSVRIKRAPAKDLGRINDNGRHLKSRGEIRRGRGEARLGSPAIVATALLVDLRCRGEEVEVQRQEENREKKEARDQMARTATLLRPRREGHSKSFIRGAPTCQE
jgi:hypothetical protein